MYLEVTCKAQNGFWRSPLGPRMDLRGVSYEDAIGTPRGSLICVEVSETWGGRVGGSRIPG